MDQLIYFLFLYFIKVLKLQQINPLFDTIDFDRWNGICFHTILSFRIGISMTSEGTLNFELISHFQVRIKSDMVMPTHLLLLLALYSLFIFHLSFYNADSL